MQTVASLSSSPPDLLLRRRASLFVQRSFPFSGPTNFGRLVSNRKPSVIVASSAASFDGLDAKGSSFSSSSKESVLANLIQDIEPMDVSVIQKEVPAETVDAMKRTISGMLGLLPSDQFHVIVEAMWDPLFKLLVSSMMTGYTLRNAEYKLSFERNLDLPEGSENDKISSENRQISSEVSKKDDQISDFEAKNSEDKLGQDLGFQGFGEMSSEAKDYIIRMQARLNSMKKELHDLKRKNSALEMQQFVGEEKNDLLDYLRSLRPEKVAELSEPTCAGVESAIHSVAHGLLATLSPKMHSKAPPKSPKEDNGTLNLGNNKNNNDDCAELVENTSLPFRPVLSVPRDYLARLLFWCMLLGHYLRGLEYRLELMHLLTISSDVIGSVTFDNNNKNNSNNDNAGDLVA